MRWTRPREFWCPVVSEAVLIKLTRPTHLMRPMGYFVQGDQTECQYVEANEPPGSLDLGMFAEEIKMAEAGREGY